MSIPAVTPLPPHPQRDDPDFADKAGVWVEALADTYTPELNALASGLVVAASSANYSSFSTTSRQISAGAKTFDIEDGKLFVAGQEVVISSGADPVALKMWATVTSYDILTGSLAVHVHSLLGAGNTRGDWIIALSGMPGQDSGSALTNPIVTGTITEDVFAIVDGASVAINPEDGSIQTWTLGANRTPTATMVSGQSVTLMIADGSAFAVTWTSIAPVWVGGSAPTLPTTGYAVIELWKVGSAIYAAHVGNVA